MPISWFAWLDAQKVDAHNNFVQVQQTIITVQSYKQKHQIWALI